MKRPVLLAFVLLISGSALFALPVWWNKDATRIIEENGDEENYAPVGLGQLKHVAQNAMYHLELSLYLQGGASADIRNAVAAFEPVVGGSYTSQELEEIQAANFAPANLGQLKVVAEPFYDRLIGVGYDTKANLVMLGYPGAWAHDYPWDPATPVEENYSPANLGQLKMVFSFDLGSPVAGTDTDGDGLSDAWEIANGFDPNDGDENNNGIPDGLDDTDADGMVDLGEQLQGRNPNAGALDDTSGQLGLKVYTHLEL